MNEQNSEEKLLDRLRDLAHIRPDADATVRAVDRARFAIQAANVQEPTKIESLFPLRRVFATAAALLIAALVARSLFPPGASSNVAFGDMQRKVAQTKSVQYVETRRNRNHRNQVGPRQTQHVQILGRHLRRVAFRITAPGDPLPAGESWTTGPREYTTIENARTGQAIVLYPKQMAYARIQKILGIDLDSGQVRESRLAPNPDADFYERIRDVPTKEAKRLPSRKIDGKLVAGFRVVESVERPAGTDTWTRTYWVDPETKLPVRIEASVRSTNPRLASSDWVKSGFVFDVPLDESLFSTDPSEGYRDVTGRDLEEVIE